MLTIDGIFENADMETLARRVEGRRPLLLDIETTGLSPERSAVYLIGCAWTAGGGGSSCLLRQFFAETPAEEAAILIAFLKCAADFDILVHFNGDRFDLRFLRARFAAHGLDSHPLCASFTRKESLDFYPIIKPHRDALGLPDCRQKSLERLLQTNRTDTADGGKLIRVYQAQSRHPDDELRAMLLLHNADDVKGLASLIRVFDFLDFFTDFRDAVRVTAVREGDYQRLSGGERRELFLDFSVRAALPAPLSLHRGDLFLKIRDGAGRLRVPVFTGELKYFYPDPKNYFYLPAEDEAIHKSVAQFVDRSRRVPATAETCYTRRAGSFLPLPAPSGKGRKGVEARSAGDIGPGIPLFQETFGGVFFLEYKKEQDMQPYLLHVLSALFA